MALHFQPVVPLYMHSSKLSRTFAGQVDKISACANITKILQPGEKSIEVNISPGHSLQLSAGEYDHKMTGDAYNCTVHISITEGIKHIID